MVDQSLSSLSNFGLTLIVARETSAAHFGAFALAYTTYLVVLGVSESVSSDPLVIRYSDRPRRELRSKISDSMGTSLVVGMLGSATVAAIGVVTGGSVGSAFVALAVVLPGLTVQDGWRFAFFARREPRAAALNDLTWCVGQVAAFWWLLAQGGEHSVFSFVIAWGLGGWLAAGTGVLQAGMLPRPRRAVSWIRSHRNLAGSLLFDSSMITGGQQLVSYMIAAVGGLTEVAGYRGAQTLFGPLGTLTMSTQIFAIPEGVRIKGRSYAALRLWGFVFTLAMMSVAALWGIGTMLIPTNVGVAILGSTWTRAHPLLPLFTVLVVARAAQTAAWIGLRTLDSPRHIVRSRVRSSPLLIALACGGALAAGASGAVAGLAVGTIAGALIWWQQLRSAYREKSGLPLEGPESSCVRGG